MRMLCFSLRLQPPRFFKSYLGQRVLQEVMGERLRDDMRYEPMRCRKLATDLSDLILRRVKRLGFKRLITRHLPPLSRFCLSGCAWIKRCSIFRYRYVTQIHVGEVKGASIKIASRCCWEAEFDTFGSFSYQNAHIYVVAEIYAICLE